MAQGLARHLSTTAAALGWRDTFLYVFARAVDTLFGTRVRLIKYRFVVQPVGAPSAARPGDAQHRGTGSFALGEAGPDSPLFAQIERPHEVIARRFAQGARCLAATVDRDRLAGFLWYVLGPYEEDEVRARFVPGPAGRAAWDFDVSILPRFRMGRLFSYLWERASSDLAEQGVRYSISRISAFNPASIASHRRLGARDVGTATFLCLGRVQLMWASFAPRFHLSWRDGRRPEIHIDA